VSATRLSLLRAAHARESKHLFGDLTTRQTETIVRLQKSVYLQLGQLARKDGKLQAAVNSITAVQNIEASEDQYSDEANDEFGHVLWDQKEHALAIQHVEQMTKMVEATTKSNGRLAVLLARNVSQAVSECSQG
jgi:ataxia telangiectasia mutated family protein